MSLPRLSKKKQHKIHLLTQQAYAALKLNDTQMCEAHCKSIESIANKHPQLFAIRGASAATNKQYAQALAYFEKYLELIPDDIDILENIARIHSMGNNFETAISYYQKALDYCKKSQRLPLNLGIAVCHINAGQPDQAQKLLEPLLAQFPDDADIPCLLGKVFSKKQQREQAESLLNQALQNNPHHIEANHQMGLLHLQLGHIERAEYFFRHALKHSPYNASIFADLVTCKHFETIDDDVRRLQEIIRRSPQASQEREFACFAIGKAFDDMKDADRAFPFFKQGNDIRQRYSPYDLALEESHIKSIITSYDSNIFNNTSSIDAAPIFITGMPRSGSTLLEQIIASHPQVISLGECNAMEGYALASMHSEKEPLTLENIASFSSEQWKIIGESYLAATSPTKSNLRTTDKSLNNTHLIAAIHCALPQAKIIHIQRNPMAVCWSIYKNDFIGKFYGFGHQLETLGRYYLMYEQLMAHWRSILPKDTMLEIAYEDIIKNKEEVSRRVLDYCALPWDESCLDFHQLNNQVQTLSVSQVRRPIYNDSIAAWQRYEKHLRPLIDIFDDAGINY